MAPCTVGITLLIYRDHLRQCITADIRFIADDVSCQAMDLRGQKAVILQAFEPLGR
jgi:hypothetical protein